MFRTYISKLKGLAEQSVKICGTVQTLRMQKSMAFILVKDCTGVVQIAVSKQQHKGLLEQVSVLTVGSAIIVFGKVMIAPHVKVGALEIAADSIVISSIAEPSPISEESAQDKLLDFRQISLRTPAQRLVFEVQTTFERALREFWQKENFVEIHSPKLMGTFSESGAEAFKVEYFGSTAFLAQSPQFYKQMAVAGGMEKVFEIGPAFRAEPSLTSRHETEFVSVDVEIAWIESDLDIMQMEQKLLVYALERVLAEHGEEIKRLWGRSLVVPTLPFPSISVEEAHRILISEGYQPLKPDDMDSEAERKIAQWSYTQTGHEFLFIHSYPASARAFYHMRKEEKPDTTHGFDLLWQGLEITTGAQREHRIDKLVAQALERGYKMEPLKGYLDTFRYGCPPHGGFGMGLARVLMRIMGAQSIREVLFLSRTPRRLTP